jgi:hypothetical protein
MKKSSHSFEGDRLVRFGKLTLGSLRDLADAEKAGDREAYGEEMLKATVGAIQRVDPTFTRRALEDLLDGDEIAELFTAVLSFTTGKVSAEGEAKSA